MKVLMVSEYFPPRIFGGGEISAYLLAKNLAKKGIDVSVLTSYFKGFKRYEVKEGIKIYRKLKTGKTPHSILSNVKRMFLFPKSLKKELLTLDLKENYDIIHCMNLTSMYAVELKDKIKKPFIVHVNSSIAFCPKGDLFYKSKEECKKRCDYKTFIDCLINSEEVGKLKNRFYIKFNPLVRFIFYNRYKNFKKLLQKFDYYVPISNFMKEQLIKYNISKNKISILPNIVELEKFLNFKPKKNRIPKILYLGNYTKFKGPQILIEAMRNIKESFECNLYGKGPFKSYLVKLVKKYGLENKIKINESVNYNLVPQLYADHDIIVFPSLWPEPFGRIAIEAMVASKPIVASNIGGIQDIIVNGKTGLLFEPQNIDKLTQVIKKLIQDPTFRKRVGTRARKAVKIKYNSNKIAKKAIQIYRTISCK